MEMPLVFPFCVPVATGIVFVFMGNPLEFLSCVEIARVTPSLPQWGRQPKGASPLDPPRAVGFFFYAAEYDPSHAPLGEPRRGGERPWPHRYPIPVPSFSFLKSMISTEQNICHEPAAEAPCRENRQSSQYHSGTGPALILNSPIFTGIENRPDDRRSSENDKVTGNLQDP